MEATVTQDVRSDVPTVSHAAALVADLDATARMLSKLLGWGPWSVYEIEPPRLTDRRYRGEAGAFSMLGAETHVGPIDFALNQALTGPSIYEEYAARRGLGLHHLACMARPDAGGPSVRERLEPTGVAMGGRIDDAIEFAYFDTEPDLGVAIETGSGHAISLEPDRVVDLPPVFAPASLDAVSVVVCDLEAAIAAYGRLLGWGPWLVVDRRDELTEAALDGTPVRVGGRLARTRVGSIDVELVEPDSGPSLERERLDAVGPGLHQVRCGFADDQRARVEGAAADLGLRVRMTAERRGASEIHLDGPPLLALTFPAS